jgi:hypothetical protein
MSVHSRTYCCAAPTAGAPRGRYMTEVTITGRIKTEGEPARRFRVLRYSDATGHKSWIREQTELADGGLGPAKSYYGELLRPMYLTSEESGALAAAYSEQLEPRAGRKIRLRLLDESS